MEIDLLAAREFEQQIERTLETIDLHKEGRFGIRLVDLRFERKFNGHESLS